MPFSIIATPHHTYEKTAQDILREGNRRALGMSPNSEKNIHGAEFRVHFENVEGGGIGVRVEDRLNITCNSTKEDCSLKDTLNLSLIKNIVTLNSSDYFNLPSPARLLLGLVDGFNRYEPS